MFFIRADIRGFRVSWVAFQVLDGGQFDLRPQSQWCQSQYLHGDLYGCLAGSGVINMNDAKPINADDVIKFIQHAIKIVLYVIAGIVRVTGVKVTRSFSL